jgi:hypothetical protein
MDLERTFILSNVINKLEKLQSNNNLCNTNSCNTNSCNTNSEIYTAIKEEIKT